MSDEEEELSFSTEEWQQWQDTVKGVKAYDATQAPLTKQNKPQPTTHRAAALSKPRPMLPRRAAIYSDLKEGSFDGVDKATAKKLKRGQLPIDATLDLHGLSLAQAYDMLERRIMQSLLARHRLLLVITGKGRISEPGALKTALPGWLNDERLRSYLLAFERARREDGGGGAFYVLLKRWSIDKHGDTDDFSG